MTAEARLSAWDQCAVNDYAGPSCCKSDRASAVANVLRGDMLRSPCRVRDDAWERTNGKKASTGFKEARSRVREESLVPDLFCRVIGAVRVNGPDGVWRCGRQGRGRQERTSKVLATSDSMSVADIAEKLRPPKVFA